jgi:type II secretory pathway component GspD/PulD (secretin)
LVEDHFDDLQRVYDDRFADKHGFWRPVIRTIAIDSWIAATCGTDSRVSAVKTRSAAVKCSWRSLATEDTSAPRVMLNERPPLLAGSPRNCWMMLPTDFYLNIKAMEQQGIANVTSKPLIATLNGHKATLSVGTTQYFLLKTTTPYVNQVQTVFQESQSFQTIDADVKMEITPYVGANGTITVEVKPDFRTPIGQLSSDVPPTISKRSMSSTLIMREGETIVLGGLVQETESETAAKVPLLGSIPFVGKLFSSTSKSKRKGELMIYITPHISYGEAFKTAYSRPPEE